MPDLTELLTHWAELELDRCRIDMVMIDGRLVHTDEPDDMFILYSTIQAIEARGWLYHLFHDGVSTCATIEIHRMIENDGKSETWGHVGYGSEMMTDSPAIALLAAYVEALKQEVQHGSL